MMINLPAVYLDLGREYNAAICIVHLRKQLKCQQAATLDSNKRLHYKASERVL